MSRDGPKGAGGESCCVRQPCRKKTPAGGMTRRLRRGRWGCRPEGAVLSFEAKESTKESKRHGNSCGPPRYASRASVCGSRTVGRPEFIRGIQFRPKGRNSLTTFRGQTALRGCPRPRFAALTRREKALYCPLLKEGVRNVARNIVGELTPTFVRARAHSYPLSKRARLFPFAAYCRSAPPPLGWGRNDSSAGWDVFMWFGRFSKATDQQVWENYDDRWREPEGLLPDSGLYPPSGGKLTQTGEPRGLLPSGGDSAAKPHVSLRPCAQSAQSGVKGYYPLRAAVIPQPMFFSTSTPRPMGAERGAGGHPLLRRRGSALLRR